MNSFGRQSLDGLLSDSRVSAVVKELIRREKYSRERTERRGLATTGNEATENEGELDKRGGMKFDC